MRDEIIIGGGASGLFCGMLLPKNDRKLLIEANAKCGEKLLLTGNGRCNLTNLEVKSSHYLSDQPERLDQIFEKFGPHEMIDFLKQHGIETREEDHGRIFLQSNHATELLDFFVRENKENGVQILCDTKIQNIIKKADHFIVQSENHERMTKKVIIATGGKTMPKIGGSDFVFSFAEKFSIRTKKPHPALCGLSTREDFSPLSGSSIFAQIQIEKK